VYPPDPPDATTEAEPFGLPHIDATEEVASEMADGEVIVNDCVFVQPFASVIVHVYVPATKPEAVAELPPEGDHAYV